jgi:vitamin B12 transporter
MACVRTSATSHLRAPPRARSSATLLLLAGWAGVAGERLAAEDQGGAAPSAAPGPAPASAPAAVPAAAPAAGGRHADTQPVDTVIVTADREPEPIASTTTSQDVVDAARMREQGFALNAPDYLRSLPGVDVLDSAGGIDGGTEQVRLRGSASQSDTAILLDGIPLYDATATAGSPTLALLTLPGLSAIEVVRGPQSGLYGTQAVGGEIDFLSARPTEEARADGEIEVGSWDTRRVQGWVSGPIGRSGPADDARPDAPPALGFAAGVDGIDSHGFAAQTANANGDAHGFSPDGVRKIGANGRIEAHPADGVALYASGFYSNVFQEYGGYSAPDEPDFHRLQLWRIGSGAALGDSGSQTAAGVDWAHTRLVRDEVSVSNGDSSFDGADDFVGVHLRERVVSHLALTVGADGDFQQAVTTSIDHHHQDLAGAYLRGAWSGRDLDLDAAVRHDALVGDSSATTYRLGAAWWPAARLVRLHAATGTAFSAPTLDERYGFYPSPFGNFSGNPDLEPQTSGSWEGGVDLRPSPALLLAATAFRTIYHRRITAVFDALGNGTLVNEASDSAIRGVESELAWDDPHLPFAIHGSATWQRTKDDGGQGFVLLPSRKASGDVVVRAHGAWLLVGVDAVGARAATDHSGMAGYATLHAAIGWAVWHGLTIYARAENLLDKGYTVDQYSGFDPLGNPEELYYTGTPRSYFAGLEARF